MRPNHITTELMVSNAQKTFDFYKLILGFKPIAEEVEDGKLDWAKMERDGFFLSFKETRNPLQTASFHLNVDVSDIMTTYTEVKAKMETLDSPHITPCGATSFSVKDPSGYTINFEMFDGHHK